MLLSPRYIAPLLFLMIATLFAGPDAQAQVTAPNGNIVTARKAPSLRDYLVNRLKATTTDQQSYVDEVVKLVKDGKLERRLVIAVERYSQRKSPYFPLPVFERALRIEAAKRNVKAPVIDEIVARNGASAAQAVRDSRIR